MRKTLLFLTLFALLLAGCGARSGGGSNGLGLPTEATVLPEEALPADAPPASQPGSGVYKAWLNDPTAYPEGCAGMFVGGGVIDAAGNPVEFMLVRLSGSFGTEDALSGTAPQYGNSGYEILISPEMQDSSGQVTLQLFDLDSEQSVSELVTLNTYADCGKALQIVHWVEE